MARPKKKDSKPLSVRIDVAVSERLDKYCEQSGMSKTTTIERAIIQYIESYNADMEVLQAKK